MGSFMGFEMFQTYNDLQIWEMVFNQYKPQSVMELGTGYGGLTLFFALQCFQRGMDFVTYDNVKSLDFSAKLPAALGIEKQFRHVNIIGETERIGVLKNVEDARRPLVIMVDNGDKPRDFKMVAPYTQPGDIIAVHDWETEFFPEDIGDIDVEYLFPDLCALRPVSDWRTIWLLRKQRKYE